MQFSRNVSAHHRLRKIGKVKGDRDQAKIMERLQRMAGTEDLRDATEEAVAKRALDEAIAKKAGADMERIRLHPLWHDDADPTWFVISHVDKTGRRWCHADAILSMQGLVRGWVIRQKRKRAQLREERNKKSKYAVQIQRWWRRYLFRKFVAQLRRERIAQAYIDVLRFIKCAYQRPRYIALWSEWAHAAMVIQRAVRARNFFRIIKLLREKRLLDAVLKVQRKFRDHRSWKQMLKWENMITIEKAKKLRDEYLFGTKTLEEADSLRRKTEELFNKGTSMLGRKIAQTQRLAKALESQIEGVLAEGEKPEGAQVELKDVANMTKAEFWNLDGEDKDHPAIEMKLRQCSTLEQTTLDLSNVHEKSERVVITRWPFGLQGRRHGMFHITALFIHGQELAGMPIDMYRLTNITDLRLHENKIRWILPEISELVDLHICWLHGNLLTTLPGTIGKCTNLFHLSVAHCRLESLPGQLGYCRRLGELRIEGNPNLTSPTHDIARSITRPPEDTWDISIVMRYLRRMADGEAQSEIRLEDMGMIKLPSVLQDFKKVTLISLKGNRIADIPVGIFELPKLITLNLDENRIQKLSKAVCNLTVLETMSLIRNRIKQKGLPIDSLVILTRLQVLNLSLNILTTPPPEILVRDAQTIIDYLNRCKKSNKSNQLDLSSFRLKSLPSVDVDRHLTELDLHDNLLPEIPSDVFNSKGLTHLHLSSNLVHSIPQTVSRLERLVVLRLDANSLSSLPDELETLLDLTDLNISRNRLSEVPAIIGYMSNLRFLSLTHNNISEVSHKLSKLSLYDFDLSFNSMHVMPDIFDRMINLKKLNFEGNKIGVISPSVGNCKSLSDFTVSKNRLRSLSSAVAGLGELTRLRISDCAVRDVPDDLSGMACLQVLELERNELEVLPKGICTLPDLQTLRVKSNFVTQIPPHVDGLSTVTLLDLSCNRLTMVCPELRYMSRLSTLNLSSNSLRCLPPTPPYFGAVISRLNFLEHLDVRDNGLRQLPLDVCDCPRLKNLLLEGNSWTGDRGLERLLDPRKVEGAGDLVIRILQATGLAKMDGRRGLSDPFCILKFGEKSVQTGVIRSNLNPRWDQEFKFQVNGGGLDPTQAEVSMWDWDPDGSNDAMGVLSLDLGQDVLKKSIEDEDHEGMAGTRVWVDLTGEDDMGREAQGRVEFAISFRPLSGSLKSIQSYLKTLRREGWLKMPGVDPENMFKTFAVKKTPDGMLFEGEGDDLRDADEVKQMDEFRKWVGDWVAEERSKREAWDNPDVFFTPAGTFNDPWTTNKERYDLQFEQMREYMLAEARRPGRKGKGQEKPWERFSKTEADNILARLLKDEFENLDLDDD